MDNPTGIRCVIPSRLGVGERFSVKAKVLGPVHEVPCAGGYNTSKPGLRSPFNLNVQRQIQFMDNCLPEWRGELRVDGNGALEGPESLVFDGENQGAYANDARPIMQASGLRWTQPGFRFLRLVDPRSGLEALSNPCYVTEKPPAERLCWGDPHWQTFFSDGIRCPEELYAFARYESFLDFGAISDHMEGLTPRQWDYFQAVTNDWNEPGTFVALQGQEWTHHTPEFGAPGHRNVYYRGDGGPIVSCTDPDCNTLEKLWKKLDTVPEGEAIAIPHHSANVIMGVKWDMGWNPKYETAVEMFSVWGNSEKSEADGNPCPIRNGKGEMEGRHVRDALARKYRMGFVGGGDIHDGRPGEALHRYSYPPSNRSYDNGLTAVQVPALTREHVFDAMRDRRTYATTCSRIYLDTDERTDGREFGLQVRAASEDGIRRVVLVQEGVETELDGVEPGTRTVERSVPRPSRAADEYLYVRVETINGEMAWSSPVWGDEVKSCKEGRP